MIDVKLKRVIEECILNSDVFGNHITNSHDTDWTPITIRDETKIISMNEYKDSYIIILCESNTYITDIKSNNKEKLDREAFLLFIYDKSTNRLYYNDSDYNCGAGLTVSNIEGKYMEPNLSKLNL